MFEDVYDYYVKEANCAYSLLKDAKLIEKIVLGAAYLLLMSLVFYPKFFLIGVVGFPIVVVLVMERIIKRKYGVNEGFLKRRKLDLVIRNKLRGFLSEKNLLQKEKFEKLNLIIDNELKGGYVENVIFPSGIYLIIIGNCISWTYKGIRTQNENLTATLGFLLIATLILVCMPIVWIPLPRRKWLKKLKKDLDYLSLEI